MIDEREKITQDELREIFNRVLDSCPFYAINIFCDMHTVRRRKNNLHKDYFNNKLFDIESKLAVFEDIPKDKIYTVIEDFIGELENYNSSKEFKSKNSTKIKKESYALRKKDIKLIEAYQEMIFHYTSDYDYNDDEEYSILQPPLDDIYQLNKLLLEELRTKKFKILDACRYEGVKLYDSSKRPMKKFFKQLQEVYPLKTLDIKQMIDIL